MKVIFIGQSAGHSIIITHLLGFIAVETTETDGLGFMKTHTRNTTKSKSKAKGKPKTRKEMQKARYYFVKDSKTTVAYQDYFNPDVDVERRVMGVTVAVSDIFFPLYWSLMDGQYRMADPGYKESRMSRLSN